MPEAFSIQIVGGDERLRLEWDNRRAPKDNFTCGCLVLFWTVWVPSTLLATCLLIAGVEPIFFAIWSVFGWLGTLAIPYTLVARWWSEWIEVSPGAIVHGRQGLGAPKPKSYPIRPGVELYLGRFDDESNITLGLVWSSSLGIRRRALLGYWLAPEFKEQIFLAIAEFAEQYKVSLVLTKFGA